MLLDPRIASISARVCPASFTAAPLSTIKPGTKSLADKTDLKVPAEFWNDREEKAYDSKNSI